MGASNALGHKRYNRRVYKPIRPIGSNPPSPEDGAALEWSSTFSRPGSDVLNREEQSSEFNLQVVREFVVLFWASFVLPCILLI